MNALETLHLCKIDLTFDLDEQTRLTTELLKGYTKEDLHNFLEAMESFSHLHGLPFIVQMFACIGFEYLLTQHHKETT